MEADEITTELLVTLCRFDVSLEHRCQALRTAETILREMARLEQEFQDRTQPVLILGISCG